MLPASEAVWIRLNEVFPSERTPQSSPSIYACLAGRAETAAAIVGYLCVQSKPAHVNSRTSPRSSWACIRYPSYLISWSHSGPCGGSFTSLQSCGLTHLGRPGAWPRGLLFIDFAITGMRQALLSTRVQSSTENRHATGELERLPAPLFGVLPDLPVARDGAHKTHSLTSGLASNSSRGQ